MFILPDLNEKVTDNFKWKEFFRSATAKRLNINNIPHDKKIFNNIKNLCENVLQPVRNWLGSSIRITSGYRCNALNRAVKGSDTSNHLYGYAVDFEPVDSNVSMIDIVNFIYKFFDYSELILEYPPDGWIHCAYNKNNLTNPPIEVKDSSGYNIISIDDLKKDS